MREVAFTSPED
jgi:hypothetical protein